MTKRTGGLPRLAVVFEPHTVRVLQLVEAAAGTWQNVWLVDHAVEGVQPDASRLLGRFGPVVDITGLSITESAAVLEPLGIEGIITFEDAELMRAARISELLGLPANSPSSVHNLTNKAAQRAAFQAAGLPTPRYWQMPADDDEAARAVLAETISFPAVLKPLSGTGSRNVFAIADVAQLQSALKPWPETHGGIPADMIVEERLGDGWPRTERPYADYVTVESLASGGRISHVAVTGRMPMAEPFRQTGSFIPSNLPPEVISSVIDIAGQSIRALGVTVGAFHTEIKLTPEGPRVVEVNGRVGGGGVPDILSLIANCSMLKFAARAALGHNIYLHGLVPCTGIGYYYRFQAPLNANRLVRLDGLAEIRRLPGIHELFVNRNPGDRLDDWRAGSAGFLFSVLGIAADHVAMWATMRRLQDLVGLIVD